MASVIHGFMHNKDAFAELGLEVPTTKDEFDAVLDAIKADDTHEPMARGRPTSGRPLPWATPISGPTTGRARRAGWP